MEIEKLVEKAKQGDSQAFGELYELFAQRIFKYIRIKVQNRDDAQDVLQEVFIKAYKGLGSLSTERLNFSAWLYRIACNTINDRFRKIYRTPEIVAIEENIDFPSNISLAAEVDTKIDMEVVRNAFKELPPLYREVLELRYIQEFDIEEVAKIVQRSNLAVRLVQFRAMQRVKKITKGNK